MSVIFETLQQLEAEVPRFNGLPDFEEAEFLRCTEQKIASQPRFANAPRNGFLPERVAQSRFTMQADGPAVSIPRPLVSPRRSAPARPKLPVAAPVHFAEKERPSSPISRSHLASHQERRRAENKFGVIAAVAIGLMVASVAIKMSRR